MIQFTGYLRIRSFLVTTLARNKPCPPNVKANLPGAAGPLDTDSTTKPARQHRVRLSALFGPVAFSGAIVESKSPDPFDLSPCSAAFFGCGY
jgi:hypothetical protein